MGKSLIIAEKPSVATDIARVLGGFKKQKDFYESDTFVLSWAVGHLLELCMPNEMDKKHSKWSFESLPIIPDAFALKPSQASEARLNVIKRLIKSKEITSLINACDAGREGELIFRYIVQYTETTKPIQRLWLQSMTPDAIREGFSKLRPGVELESLAAAAVCRSESDWLVGINGTRALTALNSRGGGFQLTPVGRVQTPTLAMIVDREIKIRNFQPKDFWELHATFGAAAGEYTGRWFDEKFVKPAKEEDADAKAERIWDIARAQEIQKRCEGKPGVVTEEKKSTSQLSPLLYDLTSLQRDANNRFGLPAGQTLKVAQALYERHKALTYPRTDSRYLPDDYVAVARDTLKVHSKGVFGTFAQKILTENWVHPNRRIFNGERVSDHFAIIPTKQAPENLNELERKIYELVFKRFLAVFYPAAQFEVTTRITRVENEPFKTEGKVLKDAGWMAVYGRDELNNDEAATLVPVSDNEKVTTKNVEVRGLQTKPPARFTEATLLSAMEGAGKLVDDEELREAMAKKGLGTPATRAAIIDGLLRDNYMARDGKELSATPKAIALMDLLHAIHIQELSSPELTGEWEFKLKQIESKQFQRATFMQEIANLTRAIVDKAHHFDEAAHPPKPFAGRSLDGQPMVEAMRAYQTKDGSFKISKYIAGRVIAPEEALELLEKRTLGPVIGFRSRMGRPFAAALKLTDEGKVEFVFENQNGNAGERPQPINEEPVGVCPIDGGKVLETLTSYQCEHSLKENPTCKFRSGKMILTQAVTREQMSKLLVTKKTDLLTGFVSQRTRRKFSAFLVLQNEGKVGFEFQPRGEKKTKPAPASATPLSEPAAATAAPAPRRKKK